MTSTAGRRAESAPNESAEPRPFDSTIEASQPAGPADDSLERLEAATLGEMTKAWRAGAPTPAEKWLQRQPRLAARPESAVRIVYEEVCLREEAGEFVEPAELYGRFPQWQSALEVLLDCHRLMQPERAASAAKFPEAGQRLGEFQLLCELDRGAAGRVFLATQPALSDRPLVVKLTSQSGDEHLSLARLQHTHIAPLFLAQDFPAENLRALCMPYLGGASWARLMQAAAKTPPRERTGRQIVELLAAAHSGLPVAPTASGPALNFLSRATYVEAVSWIGSCLADALHYAHQRGLVHLDIKPGNVLLAGDGQPMLLDFHVARSVVRAGSGPIDRLGGTRGYMSSEQELAAAAVREGRPPAVDVDGRSDIYSLGVLLYEALSGQLPHADPAVSRRRLRDLNPQVSRGVEDLLHKCLARDPAARYADAGALAADLRRHLADLPLFGVPNRSLRERWRKWRRRKPHAVWLAGMALAALAVTIGVAALFVGERVRQARLALEQGQQHIDSRDYGPAVQRLESGWDAIRWMPGDYDLKQALQAQLKLAKRAQLAEALHELVDRLRFVESFQSVPAAKMRELAARCSTVWQARSQIVPPGAAESHSEIERQLRIDLLDLALMWADLRIRLAPAGDAEPARRDALRLLDEAQALCGKSPVLELARRNWSGPSNSDAPLVVAKPALAPQTAWEHYVVGRLLFRSDQLEEAREEFQQSIDLEPNAFWPNFYQTLCAYRLEHFEEALNVAYVCVALSPLRAECFYNRALAHQALGHAQPAIDDFGRALQLEPTLAVAALHRGMLLTDEGRYSEADTDFETALAQSANPAEVYYQMAVAQLAQYDRPAAQRSLDQALDHDAEYAPAAALKKRLAERP